MATAQLYERPAPQLDAFNLDVDPLPTRWRYVALVRTARG